MKSLHALYPPDASRICHILGVTAADVRTMYQFANADIVGVLLWNHRLLYVTGLEYSVGHQLR